MYYALQRGDNQDTRWSVFISSFLQCLHGQEKQTFPEASWQNGENIFRPLSLSHKLLVQMLSGAGFMFTAVNTRRMTVINENKKQGARCALWVWMAVMCCVSGSARFFSPGNDVSFRRVRVCWRSILCAASEMSMGAAAILTAFLLEVFVSTLYGKNLVYWISLVCLDFLCNIDLFHRTDTLRTACFWSEHTDFAWSSIINS